MSHDHWCPLGQHYIRRCACKDELPVNKVCAPCVVKSDNAKDQAVKDALKQIIDSDKGPVIQ